MRLTRKLVWTSALRAFCVYFALLCFAIAREYSIQDEAKTVIVKVGTQPAVYTAKSGDGEAAPFSSINCIVVARSKASFVLYSSPTRYSVSVLLRTTRHSPLITITPADWRTSPSSRSRARSSPLLHPSHGTPFLHLLFLLLFVSFALHRSSYILLRPVGQTDADLPIRPRWAYIFQRKTTRKIFYCKTTSIWIYITYTSTQ